MFANTEALRANFPVKLLFLVLAYLSLVIWFRWDQFSITYTFDEYERRYAESQYVLGTDATHELGDGDIYTYAGIRYLQGVTPTEINFEHPPLGKMLYGLSYLLTGMPNWTNVFLAFIAFYSYWYIASHLFDSYMLRWISLFMFMGHSLTYTYISQTMLDWPVTAFSLLSIAGFLAYLRSPSNTKAAMLGLFLGLMLASKYALPIYILLVGLITIYIFMNNKRLEHIVVMLLSALLVYFATYILFFTSGNTLLDFLRFEWWRWSWYQGKTDNPKLLMLQTLFLGRHVAWWSDAGEFINYPHWSLLWPASFVFYIVSFWKIGLSRMRGLFIYKIWGLLVFLIYLLGAEGDRYLLPLVPVFILFGLQLFDRKSIRRSQAN